MKISVGNPVEGENFFDREIEQQRAWRKLETSHLLMLAPRRIGKTSLILRLCATAEQHQIHAVECSFAKCESERDCIRLLVEKLAEQAPRRKKLADGLTQALNRIKGITIGVEGVGIEWGATDEVDWRGAGEALGKLLSTFDQPWLVCVDELPVFIINLLKQGEVGRQRARGFLYWFRDLRQSHYQRVKWLLAGSIGLDTVAARLGLSDTINDLEPFPLPAFEEDIARAFLAELSNSYGMPLDEDLRRAIVQRVGWPVPYYLQLMFSQLRDEWSETGTAPDAAAVERAFERLLDPAYRVHFDYWRQRLDEELGQPESGHAQALLSEASRSSEGLAGDTLGRALSKRIHEPAERDRTLAYLLDVLTADGYLVPRDGRYAFRLEWLRVYWLRRVAA